MSPSSRPEPSFSRKEASPPATSDTAIVLTGAIAQGAFAAGALEVLARHHAAFPIVRIVATSAGALSGTLLAAGIRGGCIEAAAAALVEHWSTMAHWGNALEVSPRALLGRRGISTSRKVHGVLRRAIAPLVPGARRPIELQLVVTALAGDPTTRDRDGVSSFESLQRFRGEDFDTANGRERIVTAATASAALPGLFAPVHLAGTGPCLDGGATNNAPIGHALEGCGLRRVILISNTPALVDAPPLHGLSLVEHLVEVLVHERLSRDLRTARRRNRQLLALDQLAATRVLAPDQLAAVRKALGWQQARRLELVEIRPSVALRGGAFTGLADRALRVEYIAEGRQAAEQALAATVGARVERTTQRPVQPQPLPRRPTP